MGYRTYTCPISKRCGGCEWLSVPYELQLKRKQRAMEGLFGEQLARDGAELAPIVAMREPLRYRAKAATPFAPDPNGKGIQSGFFEAHSHRIVACKDCLVEYEAARRILNVVTRAAQWVGIPAYDEDRGTGVLRHAIVRCGFATNDVLLTLVTNGPRLPRASKLVREILSNAPEVTSIVQNENPKRTNAILGPTNRTLYGNGIMHDRLLGCTFEIGPTSFYQTNPQQTEYLYQLAIDGSELSNGERLLDAYCGTGTIGICAAAQARKRGIPNVTVVGVEQVGAAIDCARRNAEANGLADSCTFIRDDATDYLVQEARHGKRADVVILDPPRAGSTPAFLHSVVQLAPHRVVYVSCNPKTQARDLSLLRQGGYWLERITPVDMFPHTRHVETVAVLARGR